MLQRCGVDHAKIAVPFVAATGFVMFLGVVKITENRQPRVCRIFNMPLTLMPFKTVRLQTFACFALLIAKQHGNKESINLEAFQKEFQKVHLSKKRDETSGESTAVKEIGKYSMSAKRRRNNSENAGQVKESASGAPKEEMAAEAASVGGKIRDLRFPWPGRGTLDTEDIFKHIPDQTESPFYFRGQLVEDPHVLTFCKVWREGDTSTPPAETVEEEIQMLELANQHGVPAPKVWLDLSSPTSWPSMGAEGDHWLRSVCRQFMTPTSLGRIGLDKAKALVESSLDRSERPCHPHMKKAKIGD